MLPETPGIEGLPFICLHEIKDKQLSNICFCILCDQRYCSLKFKILSRSSVRKKIFPFLNPFISQPHTEVQLSCLCGTSLMCFLHTSLICTCELQVVLLLRFSLQIHTMFDNSSTEINLLVLEAVCLLLYVHKLLTDFTPNFSVQFRAKSSISRRLVLCSVRH